MNKTGSGKKGNATPSDKKAPAMRTGVRATTDAKAPAATKGASAKKGAKAPAAPKAAQAAASKAALAAPKAPAASKAALAAAPKAAHAAATSAPTKATKGTVAKVRSLVTDAHKVSEAQKARAESLLAEIGRRKERIVEDFYEIGLALRELARKELFRALKFASFEAMLDARDVMSLTTARRLIQLVSTMSRDEALAYGQEKALALLAYAKATPEVDTPKSLVEGGKLPGGKPIVKASVRELKEAAKQVRTATEKRRATPSQDRPPPRRKRSTHGSTRAGCAT